MQVGGEMHAEQTKPTEYPYYTLLYPDTDRAVHFLHNQHWESMTS